ncbi:MAG: CvpA family protein [Oscillibacter sp.]|nr:CvpA family protein [Oscillibacter sp.]
MTTAVIIDIVVVLILVGFGAYGAKQGLLQSLAGLVVTVVALVGAGMIAATFSAPVTHLVAPLLREQIASRVEEAVAQQVQTPAWTQAEEDPEAFRIQDLLELLGVDEEARDALTGQIRESLGSVGSNLSDAVAAAMVESLVGTVVYGLLYLLAFLLLSLLLNVLVGAMDLVAKLPGLHALNSAGGAVAGLVKGALLLFLAVWVARRFGVSFDRPELEQAHILHIFTENTPLRILSLLK